MVKIRLSRNGDNTPPVHSIVVPDWRFACLRRFNHETR